MGDVRRATDADIPGMAATLARAFARDPYFGYLAGEGPEPNLRMRDGWTAILRFASARLSETWTTDEHAGVAIWLPPEHRGPSLVDQLRFVPALARMCGWRRLREVSSAVEALEQRRAHHAPRRHFYLSALGVEPDRQGTGIGTALMAPVVERADSNQVPAYLETATARNVLLYERVGFEVVEELILPRTDVRGWLMLREPRSAGLPAQADPAQELGIGRDHDGRG